VVAEPFPQQATPELAYASWGARAGAALIDGLIMTIPYFLGIGLIIAGDEGNQDGLIVIGALLILVSVIGPFVYFPAMNGGERGQTYGKRATGIRVRREDGQTPLGFGRGLARYAITFVFANIFYVPLLLDYLWPLWDERNQSLHDKVAGSVVVRA
jgi:uncharacterized RDD family membrane protein YckC